MLIDLGKLVINKIEIKSLKDKVNVIHSNGEICNQERKQLP